MKKIKNWVALLVVLSCVFAFSACSKADPETAKWEKYDKVSFMGLLVDGSAAMMEKNDAPSYYSSIEIKEGWDKADKFEKVNIDENDVGEGKKAVTYILTIDVSDDEGWTKFLFFAELDKKENTLEMVGSYSMEKDSDWISEKTASETDAILKELKNILEDK